MKDKNNILVKAVGLAIIALCFGLLLFGCSRADEIKTRQITYDCHAAQLEIVEVLAYDTLHDSTILPYSFGEIIKKIPHVTNGQVINISSFDVENIAYRINEKQWLWLYNDTIHCEF